MRIKRCSSCSLRLIGSCRRFAGDTFKGESMRDVVDVIGVMYLIGLIRLNRLNRETY